MKETKRWPNVSRVKSAHHVLRPIFSSNRYFKWQNLHTFDNNRLLKCIEQQQKKYMKYIFMCNVNIGRERERQKQKITHWKFYWSCATKYCLSVRARECMCEYNDAKYTYLCLCACVFCLFSPTWSFVRFETVHLFHTCFWFERLIYVYFSIYVYI